MSDPTRTPLPQNCDDPILRWKEIWLLRSEIAGPAGYASWKDAAVDERIKRVAAERELQAATDRAESAERDAARYRWLRGCSPYSSAHGAVSVNWPIFDNGKLMWSENAICAEALDAAMPKPT